MKEETRQKLEAAKLVLSDERLRILMGKEKMLVEEGNVYGETIPKERFDQLIDQIFTDEVIRKTALVLLHDRPLSVEELAKAIGTSPTIVFKNILHLQRKGLVDIDKVEGNTPRYKALRPLEETILDAIEQCDH